jgi:LysR family cyn operon transcriptional activator
MAADADFRIDRLRALVAVARAGGFSRAARALGKTQSSISQAVALLEEDAGTLLVVRDGRRTHLTDAGRVLVEHGERILAALAEARGALAALDDVATGTLALGTSDTFAVHLLPPVLAAFRLRHPGVELRLDNRPSPVVAARVADRTLDVGVVSLPLPSVDRVTVQRIAPLRDVAIVPPGHPLARRRRLDLADLAAHPLVLLDRSTSARAFLDAAFTAHRLAPRIAMEMNSLQVLTRMVALGFGVSIVPELALGSDDVVAIPITGLGPARTIGVVVPDPGPPSRAARAFVERLRETLAG